MGWVGGGQHHLNGSSQFEVVSAAASASPLLFAVAAGCCFSCSFFRCCRQ